MGTDGVMGSWFALMQLAVQQGLLRLVELCSTGIKRLTPVLGEVSRAWSRIESRAKSPTEADFCSGT